MTKGQARRFNSLLMVIQDHWIYYFLNGFRKATIINNTAMGEAKIMAGSFSPAFDWLYLV